MTTIGTFTRTASGFSGNVRTLHVNVRAKIVPNAKESANAPDFRVYAGTLEIGAGWQKTSKANRTYLSVTLDDPSFPATIHARLVEGDDGKHALVWSRRTGD